MIGYVYSPDKQGAGLSGDGRIKEQKPIGLSGEGSAVTRVGPLFYWSWFHSPIEGYVEPHPHQGFEIVTYMIQGKGEHLDSQGTNSELGPGGVLLMRAGSGLRHEERLTGPGAEGVRIWFEPYLRDALKQKPAIRPYQPDSFPITPIPGGLIRTIIGGCAPTDVSIDVSMLDIEVLAGNEVHYELKTGRLVAALAVRGEGSFIADGASLPFLHRDFMVLTTKHDERISLKAQANVRIILIDVPENPGYPLYSKRP